MISKRDSKPFQIKFPIGVSKTTKTDMVYQDDWETVYGLVSDPNGVYNNNIYGKDYVFDKVVTVNAGSKTRAINKSTVILVDNMPTDNFLKGDYTVKYKFPECNGEIVIGLERRQAINLPKLYFFADEEKPLYFQLNFDKTQKVAYIDSNEILPIGINDFVWETQPENESDTKGKLKLVSKQIIGFTGNYKPFYKLIFEVVNV
jgi:hypothetical protein